MWLNHFTLELETIVDENTAQEHVHIFLDMYGNVVDKYCNMSAAQFRKSYRAKQIIEKTEAHRKEVEISEGRKNEHNSSDNNMPPTTSLRSASENNKKIGKRVKLTM